VAAGHEVAIKFSNCVGENNFARLAWRARLCAHGKNERNADGTCSRAINNIFTSSTYSPRERVSYRRLARCCFAAAKSPKSLIYAAVALLLLPSRRMLRVRRLEGGTDELYYILFYWWCSMETFWAAFVRLEPLISPAEF
jgi:hypothetical protein